MGNIKMTAEEKKSQKQSQWSFSLQLALFIQSLLPNFLFFFGRFVFIGDRKAERAGGKMHSFRSESPAQPTN